MSNHRRTIGWNALLAFAAALGGLSAAACSDATATHDAMASGLAFRFAVDAPAVGASAAAAVPVTVGDHTLDLTQVSVAVERAKLKRTHDEDDCDNSGPGNCETVRIGSATIDLPLSGDPVVLPAGALPAGTYREIEVHLERVRLAGTFDGTAFDVTLPVHVESEIEFDDPLVVDDAVPTSITVDLPVADWFMDAGGSLIDPNQILSDPVLLARVRHQIIVSLRAFEDRDHDGVDDHRRGHDDGGDHDDGHGGQGPG